MLFTNPYTTMHSNQNTLMHIRDPSLVKRSYSLTPKQLCTVTNKLKHINKLKTNLILINHVIKVYELERGLP